MKFKEWLKLKEMTSTANVAVVPNRLFQPQKHKVEDSFFKKKKNDLKKS